MPRTASLSESPQNPKQTTHHAPTRFITFSKAVHRMAVPHFGTFGVALNGLLVLKRQEKKVQGSECHRLNNTSTLTKCRLPFCWFCSQPFVHNRFEKDKKKKYKVQNVTDSTIQYVGKMLITIAVVVIDPQIGDCVAVALVRGFCVPVKGFCEICLKGRKRDEKGTKEGRKSKERM